MARGHEIPGEQPHISDIEALEFDIDMRMLDLWREISSEPENEWDLKKVAAYVRAAFGRGYCEALEEEYRGKLVQEHGYRVPTRKPEIFPEHEQL